jgi:polynucleotide 5'-kinase involved in rRNA processing
MGNIPTGLYFKEVVMMERQKKVAKKDTGMTSSDKIRLLEQYQSSSRREREILWIRHIGLREFFDEVEKAEVFIAARSASGFSIHRFNHSRGNYIEYQTMF